MHRCARSKEPQIQNQLMILNLHACTCCDLAGRGDGLYARCPGSVYSCVAAPPEHRVKAWVDGPSTMVTSVDMNVAVVRILHATCIILALDNLSSHAHTQHHIFPPVTYRKPGARTQCEEIFGKRSPLASPSCPICRFRRYKSRTQLGLDEVAVSSE